MKGKHIILQACLIFLVFVLLLGIMLCFVDWKHEAFNGFFLNVFKKENYFSGDTWFSVIATCVAACPGIFCGVLALIQTQRLYKLEHKPLRGVMEAKIEFAKPRSDGFKDKKPDYGLARYIRQIKARPLGEYLNLKIDIETSNGIEVQNIIIKEVRMRLAGQEYKFKLCPSGDDNYKIRGFAQKFCDGNYRCSLWCAMHPYRIKGRLEEKFWQEIPKFAYFQEYNDVDYARLRVDVVANISYDFASYKKEKLTIRTYWDAADNTIGEGTWVECGTQTGYCSS